MIVIPARMASSRFPQKVLADIGGVPMVVATARRVSEVDRVVIATDSEAVRDRAADFGIEAVMTSASHQSGTDRVAEAVRIVGADEEEIVVNVQGDEPFIEPDVVRKVYEKTAEVAASKRPAMMVSCYKYIDSEAAEDPNHVKVVTDHEDYALYFSRSKIPYDRDVRDRWKGHLGIYGFTRHTLETFCALDESPLEKVEKLEQLRALWHGYEIAMVEVASRSFGIDTKEDLERAKKIFGV